jgi:hypothetical protein
MEPSRVDGWREGKSEGAGKAMDAVGEAAIETIE